MNRLFHSQLVTAMMLAAVALFFSPSSMEAQLRKPVSPTPLDIKERTIKDLLYFPYGCLPDNFKSAEEARQKLVDTFGICESVNLDPGLHNSDAFDFTYRGLVNRDFSASARLTEVGLGASSFSVELPWSGLSW